MSVVEASRYREPLTSSQMAARMRSAMYLYRSMKSDLGHPKMPDDTAFRILLRAVENGEFAGSNFILWRTTGHGTLGAVFEHCQTAIRHIYVVDFQTYRPRRLCRVF